MQPFIHLYFKELRKSIPVKVDTGSDVSVLPASLIPQHINAKRESTLLQGTTANNTPLSFDFTVELTVVADGRDFQHKFYVSAAVNRSLLGIDFLSQHCCCAKLA